MLLVGWAKEPKRLILFVLKRTLDMGLQSLRYLLRSKHKSLKFVEEEEDFLKALYHESQAAPLDSPVTIAQALGLSEGRLAQIVGSLALKKDITTNPYALTEQGYRRALELIRAHRIYEKYLAEHSGYEAEDWHKIANRMEHHISAEEQDRIARELRNPLFDPHGDPIPNENLVLPTHEQCSVEQLQAGTWYKVLHIEDDSVEAFRLIDSTRLSHNSIILITSIDERSIHFVYEGATYALPHRAVHAISMSALSEGSEEVEEAKQTSRLSTLSLGEEATIIGLSPYSRGAIRRRLMDLGFVKGSTVSIEMNSPMGNPTAYLVKGSIVALREDQASSVLIRRDVRQTDTTKPKSPDQTTT